MREMLRSRAARAAIVSVRQRGQFLGCCCARRGRAQDDGRRGLKCGGAHRERDRERREPAGDGDLGSLVSRKDAPTAFPAGGSCFVGRSAQVLTSVGMVEPRNVDAVYILHGGRWVLRRELYVLLSLQYSGRVKQ